jgi:alpha-L-rhamnosidase
MTITNIRPLDLEVEHESTPQNVCRESPRFSWRVETSDRGAAQTAYRLVVGRSEKEAASGNGTVWDSGRVESDRATDVTYGGPRLAADETYFWAVEVWHDEKGTATLSEPARFDTELGDADRWKGDWIAHPVTEGINGFRTPWRRENGSEWVQLDLGERIDIGSVALQPAAPFDGLTVPDGRVVTMSDITEAVLLENTPDVEYNRRIGLDQLPGFGFPEHYRILLDDTPEFSNPTVVVDRTDETVDNPGFDAVEHDVESCQGRYVRIEASELYTVDPGQDDAELARTRTEHRPWSMFALGGVTIESDGGSTVAGDGVADPATVTASNVAETERWSPEALLTEHDPSAVVKSSPRVRTELTCSRPVASARLHVCGLGYAECYVNGDRVGDGVLDPAWTDYDETALYRTYEVGDALETGENALGVWLGRGRFAKSSLDWMAHGTPRCRVHLTITYEDGSTRTVGTGPEWRAAESPVIDNDLYRGETYDAREEEHGWASPGFDDGEWDQAMPVEGTGGSLRPQRIEPMQVVDTFEPDIISRSDDAIIVDFGQNLTGWVSLSLDDPTRGEPVTIEHAEALEDDGSLSTIDLRNADATDTYLPRGDEREHYEPRFTYHGFRYARITGAGDTLDESALEAKVIHTAMDQPGRFACSDGRLNAVQHNAVWGLRGNTHSVPEDCPQRDERFGWTGDAHITTRALLFNFDAQRFHEKWMRDHDDVQSPHGYVADTIPFGFGGHPGDPTWTITQVVVPWYLYRHYGDRSVLRRQYENVRRYVEYWHSHTEDGILPAEHGRYGDWLAFEGDGHPSGPHDLFNTAFHYRTIDVATHIARILGNDADAERYAEMARTVARGFNERFLDREAGYYNPGTQAAQALALHFDIVPEEERDSVLDFLVDKLAEDDDTLQTGFLGTRPLIHTLVDHGHADVAWRIVTNEDVPSWLYMVEQGATTMWERWDSDERVGSGMNSLNHSPFTHVSEWFYEVLAGISIGPQTAITDHVELAPTVIDDLEWASASVRTPNGTLESGWERTDEELTVNCSIPWNTTADVRVPGGVHGTVSLDGTPLEAGEQPSVDGVTAVTADAGDLLVQVGSGDYQITRTP